jgi:predicted kinase
VLHFLSGQAGAGKTTLARALAEEHGALLLCEDAWIARLCGRVETLRDYVRFSTRVRAVLGPLARQVLGCGRSVVLDFAGNTPRDRQWVRSLFEAAGAGHVLHLVEASDAEAWARVQQRNATRPEGLFFVALSESLFRDAARHFTPPRPDEGFTVVRHRGADLLPPG